WEGLAHARHLGPLLAALAGCGGCGRGSRCGGGGLGYGRGRAVLLGLGGGENVCLGEAAVLAGALDLRGIDPVLEHGAPHRGGERGGAVVAGGGCRGRGGSCRSGSLLVGRLGLLAWLALSRLAGRRGVFDERDDRADFDGVADRDL